MSIRYRRPRLWPCAMLVGLAALMAPLSLYAETSVKFVQLRVQGPTDRAVIEMPVELLQYLSEHSKGDIEVGRIQGHDAKFPMAQLMQTVQGDKALNHEILFFSGPDEKGQTQTFYVKTYTRKVHTGTGKPQSLVFSVRKGGKETLSLRLSVDTVDTWARDFGSGEKSDSSDDFGPFVRACLASAKGLGVGLVLRIEGNDGELVFSLE